MSDTKEKTKTLEDILAEAGIDYEDQMASKLILLNDDHNSFEHVINCLMVHLKFTFEDAERAALTVHYKGRSVIKSGSVDELLPFKKILEEEGLSLTIED